MKTAKKLCQTMLSFILICSMFFGTGITSVIADTIDVTAVQTNLTEVKSLVENFEALEGYEQSTNAKNTINSIKDQLVIIENMITSGDLQGLDEKNDYLETIEEIISNILNYNSQLEVLIDNIYDDFESNYLALEDLESADELSNDNGAISEYINYRINVANEEGNVDLANALIELFNTIRFAENVVSPSYETMITADYKEYADVYETLYSEYLLMGLAVPEDLELTNEEVLLVYELLTNTLVDFSAILPDVGFGEILEGIEKTVSNNNLKELKVNGLELDVKELSHTVYVGYELENLEVIATAEDSKATVSITKPDLLIVGDNAVTIKIVALNGDVKEYNVKVVKLEKTAEQGDAEEPKVEAQTMETVEEEITPTYTTNKNTKDEVEEEKTKETTTEKDEEYDEEIEEESGLNGFTILLIVGGIALIGFGIYMLFGDKDDEMPKVKEVKKTEAVKQPEVKKQNKTNKNGNKSKKKNRK